MAFVLAGTALWAEGNYDGHKKCRGILLADGKEYEINDIGLKADYGGRKGIKVCAADIGLKEGYKDGSSYPVTGSAWGPFRITQKNGGGNTAHELVEGIGPKDGSIYPIVNLDIYVEDGEKYYPIEDYGVTVTVIIPYKKLEEVNDSRPGNKQYIFVFDDNLKTWIQLDDPDSGIKNVKRFDDHIEFEIEKWPVNDRMFSSGP